MNPSTHSHSISSKAPIPGLHSRRGRGPIIFLLDLIWSWHEASRQRHLLAQLDDRALEDIGITPAEARREHTSPFWRM